MSVLGMEDPLLPENARYLSPATTQPSLCSYFKSLPPFSKGDTNAFMAVASNNLATMLLTSSIILNVFSANGVSESVSNDIVYGRIVPGMGLSMLFGNMFYTTQAIIYGHQTGRTDVCSQPFGINTPGAYVFINSIIVPVFLKKLREGGAADVAAELAWKVGVGANLLQGGLEVVLSLVGPLVRDLIPQVALFTSLAGIGVTALLTSSFADAAAAPLVALPCVVVLLLDSFGGIKARALPSSLVCVLLGAALGWMDGTLKGSSVTTAWAEVGSHPPYWALPAVWESIGEVGGYVALVAPVALTVAVETIQCVEFAANAGDRYALRWSMVGDGVATLLCAACGGVFGMTVFIGHPAFKRMGAGVSYNLGCAVLFPLLCFTGLAAVLLALVPIQSLSPIIIFIGVVVGVDTFASAPLATLPAIIIGLAPAMANFATTQAATLVQALQAVQVAPHTAQPGGGGEGGGGAHMGGVGGGWGWGGGGGVDWASAGDNLYGMYLFGQGYLLTSLLWSAVLVAIIDRRLLSGGVWACVGAGLSLFGVVHADEVQLEVGAGRMGWKFGVGYLICAVLLGCLHSLQQYGQGGGGGFIIVPSPRRPAQHHGTGEGEEQMGKVDEGEEDGKEYGMHKYEDESGHGEEREEEEEGGGGASFSERRIVRESQQL